MASRIPSRSRSSRTSGSRLADLIDEHTSKGAGHDLTGALRVLAFSAWIALANNNGRRTTATPSSRRDKTSPADSGSYWAASRRSSRPRSTSGAHRARSPLRRSPWLCSWPRSTFRSASPSACLASASHDRRPLRASRGNGWLLSEYQAQTGHPALHFRELRYRHGHDAESAALEHSRRFWKCVRRDDALSNHEHIAGPWLLGRNIE